MSEGVNVQMCISKRFKCNCSYFSIQVYYSTKNECYIEYEQSIIHVLHDNVCSRICRYFSFLYDNIQE